MIKFLVYPFKTAITEIKRDNQFKKYSRIKNPKIKISSFIAASCMFIFIMSIMYLYFIYIVIGSIFVEPIGFLKR